VCLHMVLQTFILVFLSLTFVLSVIGFVLATLAYLKFPKTTKNEFLTVAGNGSQLTALNASELKSGFVSSARIPNDFVFNTGDGTIDGLKTFKQGLILAKNSNPIPPGENDLELFTTNHSLYTIDSNSTITTLGTKSHIFTCNSTAGQVIANTPGTFYLMPFPPLVSGLPVPANFIFSNAVWTYTGPGTIQTAIQVSMFLTISPTQTNLNFRIFKNGVDFLEILTNQAILLGAIATSLPFSAQFPLSNGDFFDIRLSTNVNSDQIITQRGFTVSVCAI
jgi:hypothetical protein